MMVIVRAAGAGAGAGAVVVVVVVVVVAAAGDLNGEVGGGVLALVGVAHVEQVVAHRGALGGGGLVGAHVHAPVDLHGTRESTSTRPQEIGSIQPLAAYDGQSRLCSGTSTRSNLSAE